MTPTQRKRLKQVRDAIEAAGAEHFDMDTWIRIAGRGWSLSEIGAYGDDPDIQACGTTACIAGFARLVADGELRGKGPISTAEWLGVRTAPDGSLTAGSWLFAYGDWPQWAQNLAVETSDWQAALVLIDEILARSPRTRFPKEGKSLKRRLVRA